MTKASEGTKEWTDTTYPVFDGLKAFVLDGAFYTQTISFLAEAGFERAMTMEEADLAVFIGGSDVNPALYNQKVLPKTTFSHERDVVEEYFFNKAKKLEVPMFGICRGAQFLHVMNGGKLWQDVNNHAGHSHVIIDIEEDKTVRANSYHHQMIQDHDTLTVVAVCNQQIGTVFEDEHVKINLLGKGNENRAEMEIEAGFYKDTRCFFVQGHPEIGNLQYRSWCLTKLHEIMMEWSPFKKSEGDIALEVAKVIG